MYDQPVNSDGEYDSEYDEEEDEVESQAEPPLAKRYIYTVFDWKVISSFPLWSHWENFMTFILIKYWESSS